MLLCVCMCVYKMVSFYSVIFRKVMTRKSMCQVQQIDNL